MNIATVHLTETREFRAAIALLRQFVEQGNQQYVPDEDMESLMAEAETFLEHGLKERSEPPMCMSCGATEAFTCSECGSDDPTGYALRTSHMAARMADGA